jgi:hypothetical protein
MAKVKIPRAVLDGIMAVRASGKTNMIDRPAVAAIALELNHVDAAIWLDDPANKKTYATGIFQGFEPVDEPFD